MASHDNLVLIINQLLQGLDKIGDSLSVVKAIGEDVKATKEEMEIMKRRVVKIEERIGDELPRKPDVSAIREMLDQKMKPLDQIGTMDERMLKIERSISQLSFRSIDSETNTDISDTVKNTEKKLVSMEETMNKLMLSMENATQNRRIDSETNAEISDRVKNTEKKLVSMEETMNKLMLSMENATQNRMEKNESRLDSIENTLQSFNETMMNVLKNMPGNGDYMHFDDLVKGKKIMLLNNRRTAIRKTPREDLGNYGGVLSKYHLRDDVAFEVRMDETIDEFRDWGIALGVIVEKDEAVKEKAFICHVVRGTYCIASWLSGKGKSDIRKDGKEISSNAYSMGTRHLPVGTTLGVVRRSNNALHFLLNGIDQGAAFDNIPHHVYAFVDVSLYVSKVSIIS